MGTRKRRRKRRRAIGLPIVLVMMILMIAMVGVIAYWYLNGNKLRLPGQWQRELDFSKQVEEQISDYLVTATLGDEIDVSKYLDDVTVTCVLSISRDGVFEEKVDEASYNYAYSQAKNSLHNAVYDLIRLRIESNYIETDKKTDELITEALGMDLDSYLKEYGPKLMPSYEELNADYGMTATYAASREGLQISTTDDIKDCEFAVSGDMLVIDYADGAIVYHAQKQSAELEVTDEQTE